MPSEKTFKNTMESLFNVLSESLNEMNEDKEMWEKKMENMKEISESMSDYIKELNEASMSWGEEESEDLTNITTERIDIINKFEKEIPKIKKTMKSIQFPDPDKSKQISKEFSAIKKQIKNKKIEVKIANPTNPNIKLKPIQKLKYLNRKNK
ncbi:MAG: hypothetical protein Lokiarch_42690 [Candidatus Lokiarchaeum sp. GC14_75]|nr:MAG: hypothetical protein Lokiarch_42690 [Candidatus Lokiarchaeum sp. GC14_75]